VTHSRLALAHDRRQVEFERKEIPWNGLLRLEQ